MPGAVATARPATAGVSDHGLLTGLGDDDHTEYVLLAGRSGGQLINGGTAASEELILRGTTNANLGLIRARSPITFDDVSAANALQPYSIRDASTASFTAAFIGGTFADQRTISFSNALFIYETLRGSPAITSGVAPAFAAFTLFNALPQLISGTGATHNPIQALILNAGPTIQHLNTGSRTCPAATGVNFAPSLNTRFSNAQTLLVTNITGLTCQPTYNTNAGTTVSFGTIRAVWARVPTVALFGAGAGTEVMTAYIGLDVDAIAFGGNVTKAAVRSGITPATNAYFLLNNGGAQSDFGGGNLLDCGVVQCLGDGVAFSLSLGAAGGDVTIYWDGSDLVFDPLTGDNLEWTFTTSSHTLQSADFGSGSELRLGFERFALGQTGAVGNQVGVFVAGARTTSVNGEWVDWLFTSGGNLTIDDTMGLIYAAVINPLSITSGAGSFTEAVGLNVGMTTSNLGGNPTSAIRTAGRFLLRGALNLNPITAANLTADVDNYQGMGVGNSQRTVLRVSTDGLGARTITGFDIDATTVRENDCIVVVNVGTENITLADQNASSDAENRIITNTGADLVLAADECAILWYDDTTDRWRVISTTGT